MLEDSMEGIKVHNGCYYTHPDLAKEIAEGLRRTGIERVERHKNNMENKQEYLKSIRLKVAEAMAAAPLNRYTHMRRKPAPNRYWALRNGYILRKVYGLPYYQLVATRKFGRLKTKTQYKRANSLEPSIGRWDETRTNKHN
jgi:hypothetical protein